jgi:hypothetical protein
MWRHRDPSPDLPRHTLGGVNARQEEREPITPVEEGRPAAPGAPGHRSRAPAPEDGHGGRPQGHDRASIVTGPSRALARIEAEVPEAVALIRVRAVIVLALNCGSSSLKFQVFASDPGAPAAGARHLARGLVQRIGDRATLMFQAEGSSAQSERSPGHPAVHLAIRCSALLSHHNGTVTLKDLWIFNLPRCDRS